MRVFPALSAVSFVALLSAPAWAQTGNLASLRPSDTPESLVEEADRAIERVGGHSRPGFDDIIVPALVDIPFREIVDPSRYIPGSTSRGTTSDGSLTEAARLPLDSDVHFVLPEHRERDTHYGTDELVALLLDASRRTAELHPGARAGIGNMSQYDGGDIRWSRSHNAGRDADVAFFVQDEDGNPVEPETLVSVGRRGTARDGSGLRFDVARNWTFVESLLLSEEAQVQWIFVYDPLRRQLLDYAEMVEADPELIARAERILHQPGDSAPHNDHYHIRVYCSEQDRLEGCVNWGPRWDHVDYYDESFAARVRELIRGLMDPHSDTAHACADFLEEMHPREEAVAIASAFPHQRVDIQHRLIELLADLDQPGVTGALVPFAESGPDDDIRTELFWLFGRLADQSAAPALAGVLERDLRPLVDGTPARLAAAEAMRNIYADPTVVPTLIDALSDERAEVRAAIAHVLHRTTARVSAIDPGQELTEQEHAEVLEDWRAWFAENGELPREEWLEHAFARAGYDVGNLATSPRLSELVDAVDDSRDWIAFNADRLLNQHTTGWTPSESWSVSQRRQYWSQRVP